MNSEVISKTSAQALLDAWWYDDMEDAEFFNRMGRLLTTPPASGEVVGVPVVPTEAMIKAMRCSDDWPSLLTEEAQAIYAAILAAAPQQTATMTGETP